MKYLFLLCLYCACATMAVAQVSGKLTNAAGQPVAFANIALFRETDTVALAAAITDTAGRFHFNQPLPGNYILHCRYTGYQLLATPVFAVRAAQPYNAGTLRLQEQPRQLDNIVVKTARPLLQQTVYGTVIRPDNSIVSAGSSVAEVLERSPGVVIDHRYNTLSLNGKSGVLVMLNGKLLRLSMEQVLVLLGSINATDVEKIELLSVPPAGYDAEGSAGVINIVLKKNIHKGTGGNVSVTAGYGWREKAAINLSLAHNTGKVNTYGSYAFSHNRGYMQWQALATEQEPFLGGEASSLFLSVIKPVDDSHNATLGMDVKLGSKTTAGASVVADFSHSATSTVNKGRYLVGNDSLFLLHADIQDNNRWTNVLASAYVENAFNKKEKLNTSFDYLRYTNNRPSLVHSSFVNSKGQAIGSNDTLFSPGQKGYAHSLIQVGVLKTDYTRQFSEKIKLETGIKATYTSTVSTSGIQSLVNGNWVSGANAVNNTVMNEAIGAAYAAVNANIDERTSLSIGTRYEYSHTQLRDRESKDIVTDRKLGKLFPTIFASRKLNGQSELQFSYAKRISRPSYNDLASFKNYIGATSIATGNPLLQPTVTDILKLGYTWRGYAFAITGSKNAHPIVRYQLTENAAGDIIYVSPQNLAYENDLSAQVNAPFHIGSWWNMNYNVIAGWRQFREVYTKTPAGKTYFSWNMSVSEIFKLPAHFSLELSGFYNSFSYDGTKKVADFGGVNAGIKKELGRNGGSLQLSVSDIFSTLKFTSYYGALTTEALALNSAVTFGDESARTPVFRLTYALAFGNNKPQNRQGNAAKEEQGRVAK